MDLVWCGLFHLVVVHVVSVDVVSSPSFSARMNRQEKEKRSVWTGNRRDHILGKEESPSRESKVLDAGGPRAPWRKSEWPASARMNTHTHDWFPFSCNERKTFLLNRLRSEEYQDTSGRSWNEV